MARKENDMGVKERTSSMAPVLGRHVPEYREFVGSSDYWLYLQ